MMSLQQVLVFQQSLTLLMLMKTIPVRKGVQRKYFGYSLKPVS